MVLGSSAMYVLPTYGCGKLSDLLLTKSMKTGQYIKTHRHIICFVRPLHSKPGMGSYC